MRSEYEHRTANLLQCVQSNLARSARNAQDELARQAIERADEQVTGIGRLLGSLAPTDRSSPEDVQARLVATCNALDVLLLKPAGHSLTFRAEAEVIGLMVRPLLARCLALIVNEFVVNAAKHAFPRHAAGQVTVSLGRIEDHVVCTVRDDGTGLRPIARCGTSQGLMLAERLAAEAGGHCRWLLTDAGTLAEASLPLIPSDLRSERPGTPTRQPLWRKLIRRGTA